MGITSEAPIAREISTLDGQLERMNAAIDRLEAAWEKTRKYDSDIGCDVCKASRMVKLEVGILDHRQNNRTWNATEAEKVRVAFDRALRWLAEGSEEHTHVTERFTFITPMLNKAA